MLKTLLRSSRDAGFDLVAPIVPPTHAVGKVKIDLNHTTQALSVVEIDYRAHVLHGGVAYEWGQVSFQVREPDILIWLVFVFVRHGSVIVLASGNAERRDYCVVWLNTVVLLAIWFCFWPIIGCVALKVKQVGLALSSGFSREPIISAVFFWQGGGGGFWY